MYNPEKDPMQLMATNMSHEADLLWANFKKHRNKRRRTVEGQRLERGEQEQSEPEASDGKSDKPGTAGLAPEAMDVDAASPAKAHGRAALSLESGKAQPAGGGGGGGDGGGESAGAAGQASSDTRMLLCEICRQAGREADGEMVQCDASGSCFHLSCLQEPPMQILDGPFICPRIVDGLEEWQRPRAPALKDNLQLTLAARPCGICRERKEEQPVRSCTGCYTRYHVACLAASAPAAKQQSDDKCWLCANCQVLLPSPERRAHMLRALVRRELVFECRRLIHLCVRV